MTTPGGLKTGSALVGEAASPPWMRLRELVMSAPVKSADELLDARSQLTLFPDTGSPIRVNGTLFAYPEQSGITSPYNFDLYGGLGPVRDASRVIEFDRPLDAFVRDHLLAGRLGSAHRIAHDVTVSGVVQSRDGGRLVMRIHDVRLPSGSGKSDWL